MGLTKRGSRHNGRLTVSRLSVRQTDNFTVQDTSQFVTLTIPTAHILRTKVKTEDTDVTVCLMCEDQISFFCESRRNWNVSLFFQACAEDQRLLQPFYRVDVVLSFKETNHKMHWSVENTRPCAGECGSHQHIKRKWWLITGGIIWPLAILLWRHQALAFVCRSASQWIILYGICHTQRGKKGWIIIQQQHQNSQEKQDFLKKYKLFSANQIGDLPDAGSVI